MTKEKQDGGVHFHGNVSFQNGSALQTGDHATFEYHGAATAGFARDLQAMQAELTARQAELGETVVEALGNMLRKLALVPTADAGAVQARLKALEDEQFVKEVLPQLRSAPIDWEAIMKAAKVAAETAKTLAPLLKMLAP